MSDQTYICLNWEGDIGDDERLIIRNAAITYLQKYQKKDRIFFSHRACAGMIKFLGERSLGTYSGYAFRAEISENKMLEFILMSGVFEMNVEDMYCPVIRTRFKDHQPIETKTVEVPKGEVDVRSPQRLN